MKDKLNALIKSVEELGASVEVKVEGKVVASAHMEEKTLNVDIDNADAVGKILKHLK